MPECEICGDMPASRWDICPACGLTLCEQCGEPAYQVELCSMGGCESCH